MNKKTKVKLIISVPETKSIKNKTAATTGTVMSDDAAKTRRSNSSNGSYERCMSDVDSMMIHAYRNESTMMITMMYDTVDDTIIHV